MKRIRVLVYLAPFWAGVVLLLGCWPATHQRYRDELVTITEHSTINFANVHASTDTEVLSLWNRKFKDVRGRNPCYLRIPGCSSILFVTGRSYDGGQATVHLADTASRTVKDFPAYDSHIGSEIGPPKSDWYERVASVEGNRLVIEAAQSNVRYKYFIDLSGPRFEREEREVASSSTGKIFKYVYEGGIAPR